VGTTLRELDALDVTDRKVVRRWLDSYMVMWARVHNLCAAHWEAVNVDSSYAQHLMTDAIGCASIMETVQREGAGAVQDQNGPCEPVPRPYGHRSVRGTERGAGAADTG